MKIIYIIFCLLITHTAISDSNINYIFDNLHAVSLKNKEGKENTYYYIDIKKLFMGLVDDFPAHIIEKSILKNLEEKLSRENPLYKELILECYPSFGQAFLEYFYRLAEKIELQENTKIIGKKNVDISNSNSKDLIFIEFYYREFIPQIEEKLKIIKIASSIKTTDKDEKIILNRIINYSPCEILISGQTGLYEPRKEPYPKHMKKILFKNSQKETFIVICETSVESYTIYVLSGKSQYNYVYRNINFKGKIRNYFQVNLREN